MSLGYHDYVDLALAIVVAFILLYTAALARRSARAAETAAAAARDAAEAAKRSAQTAEGLLAVEAGRDEESWIQQLSTAFPDPAQVTAILKTLPPRLAARWEDLAEKAAQRNQNERPVWKKHLEKHRDEWAQAASHRLVPTKG